MADYGTLKVPDLKKLLQDRGLAVSGNKADLIARLQEADNKPSNSTAPSGAAEDEIDWDEDDSKATTAPAAAAVSAGGQGQVANPVAVPNQELAEDPAKTNDLTVTGGDPVTSTTDATAVANEVSADPVPTSDAPAKVDFSIGIQQSDADKEAEKRAARAKRFGITEDDDEKKKADRAKKFGTESVQTVVNGLDSALPERRQKRGREGGDKQAGRNAKRQTPDRRTAPPAAAVGKNAKTAPAAKKQQNRVMDDPVEKAKAEARAKRFQTAA